MNTATYKVKWTSKDGVSQEQLCFNRKDLKELLNKLWMKELTYRIINLEPQERKVVTRGTPEPCSGCAETT